MSSVKNSIEKHINILRQTRTRQEFLRDLQIIIQKGELTLSEMVGISTCSNPSEKQNPAISSYILRTFCNEGVKSSFSEVYNSIVEEIEKLKAAGVDAAENPVLTIENLYESTLNSVDYISRTGNYIISSAFNAVEKTLEPLEKIPYLKGVSSTTSSILFYLAFGIDHNLQDMLTSGTTSLINSLGTIIGTNAVERNFNVSSSSIKNPLSILVKGATKRAKFRDTFVSAATSAAINNVFYVKGTDIAPIISSGALACLGHNGLIFEGISSAILLAANKNLCKLTEQDKLLEKKDYLGAGLRYYGSQKITAGIAKIAFASHPIMAVTTLAALVVINVYLSEKAKGNINEKEIINNLVSKIKSTINDIEKIPNSLSPKKEINIEMQKLKRQTQNSSRNKI